MIKHCYNTNLFSTNSQIDSKEFGNFTSDHVPIEFAPVILLITQPA